MVFAVTLPHSPPRTHTHTPLNTHTHTTCHHPHTPPQDRLDVCVFVYFFVFGDYLTEEALSEAHISNIRAPLPHPSAAAP